jgi:hypothetical protein
MSDTQPQPSPTTRTYRVLRLVRTVLGVLVAAATLCGLVGWL